MEARRQVIWSPDAVADLRQLHRYISERNPAAGARVLGDIVAAVNRLAELPGMGRPGRVPGSREWVVAPYVVMYGVSDEFVEVIRVVHGARRWPPD
jgi:addiction module RelE/StbE family toxin